MGEYNKSEYRIHMEVLMRFNNCEGFIYEVQPGDTLYGIGRRYGLPIGWIINANRDIDIYNLYVGLQICIPKSNPNMNNVPIVPNRPWPGSIGGPGPVIINPVPPMPEPGPGPVRPPMQGQRQEPGPGPVRPPMPRNPFMQFLDEEDEDNGGQLDVTDANQQPQDEVPYIVVSYVVKKDDRLEDILNRFGINASDILKYNETLDIYLKPGTVIRVPNRNAMDQ